MCHSEVDGNTVIMGQRVDSCTNPATGCIIFVRGKSWCFCETSGRTSNDWTVEEDRHHNITNSMFACCFLMDARFSDDESLRTCLFF